MEIRITEVEINLMEVEMKRWRWKWKVGGKDRNNEGKQKGDIARIKEDKGGDEKQKSR